MGGNRGITKMEMLLAVAMSEFFEKSHVLFVPPKTEYTRMLIVLTNAGFIQAKGLTSYSVTDKGHNYIQSNYDGDLEGLDNEIDNFVDNLP